MNCGSCSFFSLASFYQTELSLTPRLPRSCCAFGAGVRSTTCSEGTAPLAPGAPHPSLYTISRPLISWASLRKGSAKTGTQSSREQIASCTVSSLYYMSLVPLPPMMIFYLSNTYSNDDFYRHQVSPAREIWKTAVASWKCFFTDGSDRVNNTKVRSKGMLFYL